MITKRIIPCLDVKNGRVVKGTNFQNLNDVSSPVELGKYYSDCGADELVFYDITASSDGRKLFTDILTKVWGTNYFGEEKIVDVNIRRLRMKVEDEPSSPKHLMTVWGMGYKWNSGK